MSVRTTQPKKSGGHLRARRHTAVVLVALAATAVACGGPAPSTHPGEAAAPPDSAATTSTLPTSTTTTLVEGVELHYTETPIDLESGTLAPNADGVWVFPHNDNAAFHLSAGGVVERRVDLPDYGSVASDQGDVWAVFPLDSPALFHLDANNLQQQQRWSNLPIEDPMVRFGSAWAGGSDGKLYRARPGQPNVETYDTGATTWPCLGFTDTAVWTLGGSHLQQIDPVTGVITDETALTHLLPGPAKCVSAAGTYVILTTGDQLFIVDPATRGFAEIDAPAGYVVVDWYAAIDAGNGRFWVGLVPDEWKTVDIPRGTPTPDTLLLLVDGPSARVVAWVNTPFPEDFEPTADGLWIAPLRQMRVLHVSTAGVPG